VEAGNVVGDKLQCSSQPKIIRCFSRVVAVSGREDKSDRGEDWFILKMWVDSERGLVLYEQVAV
jgi:hypothetical protein